MAFSRAAKVSAAEASFSRSPSSRKYASPELPVHSSESRKRRRAPLFAGKSLKYVGFEAYCLDGKEGEDKKKGRYRTTVVRGRSQVTLKSQARWAADKVMDGAYEPRRRLRHEQARSP
jgi:hypothetical protein